MKYRRWAAPNTPSARRAATFTSTKDAVRAQQVRQVLDADRRTHVAARRNHHEADERDGGVPAQHHLEAAPVKQRPDDCDGEQAAEPDGGEQHVQEEGAGGGVVVGGSAAVALKRHGYEACHGDHGHEDQHGDVAHGEAEHRDDRREQGGGQPRLAELGAGEEETEHLAEGVVDSDRLVVDQQEREEPGRARCDGPDGRAGGGHVEGPAELRAWPSRGRTARGISAPTLPAPARLTSSLETGRP